MQLWFVAFGLGEWVQVILLAFWSSWNWVPCVWAICDLFGVLTFLLRSFLFSDVCSVFVMVVIFLSCFSCGVVAGYMWYRVWVLVVRLGVCVLVNVLPFLVFDGSLDVVCDVTGDSAIVWYVIRWDGCCLSVIGLMTSDVDYFWDILNFVFWVV